MHYQPELYMIFEANYSECVPSKIHVCHVEAPEQTQETDFLHLLGKSWKITGLPPAMPQETWPCFYVPQVSVFPHKSNKGNTCPAWSSEHYDPVTATAVTGLWKETPFTTASCVQTMLGNQENSRSLEWLIKFRSFCSRALPVLPTILCTKKVRHCGWRWAVGWFSLRKGIFSIYGNKPRKRLPWKIIWHQNIDYSRLQFVSKKKTNLYIWD